MLDAQEQYLDAYCKAIRDLAPGRPSLTESDKHDLELWMNQLLLGARLGFMIRLSEDAVAREMANGRVP